MKTKAIIFDKDGTLMDFYSFWVTITRFALADMLRELGREDICIDDILSVLGVKNGVTDITSVFCYGTSRQVGEVIYQFLTSRGCRCAPEQIASLTIERFRANMDKAVISPACENVPGLLARLRDLGLKLALVTTDDPLTTDKCLRALGILDCFEMVYTDDGVCPPKPDPFCIHDLCRRLSVTPEEMVMVGDSINDMRFARNGGVRAIGVAKDPGNQAALARHADVVIRDISHILEVIG